MNLVFFLRRQGEKVSCQIQVLRKSLIGDAVILNVKEAGFPGGLVHFQATAFLSSISSEKYGAISMTGMLSAAFAGV